MIDIFLNSGLDLISPNEQRTRVRSSSKVMLNTVLSFSGPRRELDYARSMGYAMSSIREKLGEPNKLQAFLSSALLQVSEPFTSLVELIGCLPPIQVRRYTPSNSSEQFSDKKASLGKCTI